MANPLSSLSYTNKDFQSVYVELLDLVKELTHKWDPSISNESDPGVILLKLNAIIADKNNYNIDKNILEAFPETVTQDINARNLYKQLAYNMPWYNSATVDVMLRWVGEELGDGIVVTIPKYTMVTDESTSVVYTLLNEVQFSKDRLVTSVKAGQGVIVTHTINSSDIIDVVNLDYRNRLYLNDYMIPENGVFITNVDDNENNLWTQVDNLATRTRGNRFYEFGVDNRNSVCYVEFPEDIDDLIKSGLNVKYLITQGSEGNIAAKVLDRFYEDITIKVGEEDVTLSSEVVQLYNSSSSNDGLDPESIEQAYRSYRKTAGTFNTLVTLRDYINVIYNSGLVSNGIVSDRLTDVQSSYAVVTDDEVDSVQIYQTSINNDFVNFSYCKKTLLDDDKYIAGRYFTYDKDNHTMSLIVDETEFDSIKGKEKGSERVVYFLYSDEVEKDMTAFDLRMYLLHTPGIINSVDAYESTFDMEPSAGPVAANVKGYILSQQCVQHDFKDITPNIPCLFKNSYPLIIKIVPQYKLTTVQQDQVKLNVVRALWEVTNSKAVEFGEEPSYDVIYDTIINADERIKVVILDDFSYTTFATYWDGEQFKDIPISSDSNSVGIIEFDSFENIGQVLSNPANSRLTNSYFIYKGETDENSGGIKGAVYRYNTQDKKFEMYSDLRDTFREQILAKSVLAGKTPLFKQDITFKQSIDQEFIETVDTERMSTTQVISPFATSKGPLQKVSYDDYSKETNDVVTNSILVPILPKEGSTEAVETISAEYTLSENESIRFLAPSFITEKSFSNYVKYELILGTSSEKRRTQLTPSYDSINFNKDKVYYISKEDCENGVLLNGWNIDEQNRGKVYLKKEDGKVSGLFFSSNSCATVSIYNLTDDENTQYSIELYSNSEVKMGLEIEAFQFYNCSGSSEIKKYEDGKLPIVYNIVKDADTSLHKHQITFFLRDIRMGSKSAEVTFTNLSSNDIVIDSASITEQLGTWEKSEDTGINTFIPSESLHSSRGLYNGKSYPSGIETYPWYPVTEAGQEGWYVGSLYGESDPVYVSWINKNLVIYEDKDLYDVPGNTDYQLKEGDYITFFWRDSDDDDAPYLYEKYQGSSSASESPIIKSNFTIHGVSRSDCKVDPTNLHSSGEIICGSVNFNSVKGFYGDNDLSGTKEIQIRKMNQVDLSYSKNKYYFITNDVVSDPVSKQYKYQMTFTNHTYQDENGHIDGASYTYTLKTDEYFIYTNSDMTEFEILGPGTLVGIPVSYDENLPPSPIITKEAVKVDYDEIQLRGIEAFGDHCMEVSTEEPLFVREQQIYALAQGDTLMIKLHTDSRNDTPASSFIIYCDGGGKIESTKPYFCSIGDTVVDGFTVSYKTSTGENVSLPQVNVRDNESKWKGRAYLNIDSSYEYSQKIIPISDDGKSVQSIAIDDTCYPVQPDDTAEYDLTNEPPFFLESNVQLNKVGGSDIDITYLDGYGNRHNTKLYLYRKIKEFSEEPFMTRSDGTIIGVFSKLPLEGKSVPINLDASSNYILSVNNMSNSTRFSLSVCYEETDGTESEINNLRPLNVHTTEDVSKGLNRGIYYFKLGPQKVTNIKFSYITDNGALPEEGDYFIIDSLFKYADNKLFEEVYGIDDMVSIIQKLDLEGKFKYNYVVDPVLKIDDPLVAKSFFDTNHIFNSYTISKAETRMSDVTGASVNIINNR